ncbi:ammonia permease [Bacillus mycoides]|uniref:ammonia permease n=1 Tax=Bacillus mycoides TaxID=1405 RepID=UPI002E243C6A|nr:ammonia permease [Bacillus mycoides]
MYILSLLYILFTPILCSCGFFGGIFLIITGFKYRKLLASVMGLLSLSFIVLPYVDWGLGIGGDIIPPIPPLLYWTLFSLTGLLAAFNGLQAKIKSICNMGFIIFTTGILGAFFYYLMSVQDSFYI